MSTSRAITAPPHEHTHSDADLTTIADLVMWRLLPSLSVRRLTQLNCRTWNMWDPVTVNRIAEARTHDDTRDWYFPIIIKRMERWNRRNFKLECWNGINVRFRNRPHLNSPELSWSWSGIFHSDNTAQGVSDRALPLPPLTHLPHEWERLSLPGDDIIASAGGLLLIKSVQGAVPTRRSSRLNGQLTLSASTSSLENGLGHSIGHTFDWKRLLVCNPLTRECRELPLPVAIHPEERMDDWHNEYRNGVQATMGVDEQSNCYQVVLTFHWFVAVYKSTTNAWRCLPFQELRPWAEVTAEIRCCREWDALCFWSYHCASVHTSRGRLFFAEVESHGVVQEGICTAANATPVGNLLLFEVDTGALSKWAALHVFGTVPKLSCLKQTSNF